MRETVGQNSKSKMACIFRFSYPVVQSLLDPSILQFGCLTALAFADFCSSRLGQYYMYKDCCVRSKYGNRMKQDKITSKKACATSPARKSPAFSLFLVCNHSAVFPLDVRFFLNVLALEHFSSTRLGQHGCRLVWLEQVWTQGNTDLNFGSKMASLEIACVFTFRPLFSNHFVVFPLGPSTFGSFCFESLGISIF